MRKISRKAHVITLGILAAGAAGKGMAGDLYNLNQTGFTLPGVSLPQGQDEVRAADGTTCRSSVSGSGAYLDVGVVGGPNTGDGGMSTYGRVVIPLGKRPKRLDCTRLYALEVERLEMEIRLLKMGIARNGGGGSAGEVNAGWARAGWSDGRDK